MTLKEELDNRIKKRDSLNDKYNKLLGKKSALEADYSSFCEDCLEIGIKPENLESELKKLVSEIEEEIKEVDLSMKDFEEKLSGYS